MLKANMDTAVESNQSVIELTIYPPVQDVAWKAI